MKKQQYSIYCQCHEDGEYKLHKVISIPVCKHKFKKYLRKIFEWKQDNFKLDMLHVWKCDECGNLLDGEVVHFLKCKKDVQTAKIY